ncbi:MULTISPECIES: amidohydrolase family protein [Rhodococcus]|uniref:amidohydrolase family protein n=1 Tax=Rhodococcus TaxID=1827 RepID=UPI001E3FA010|nr:amidohydrolase family protein [Rhodococcus pyridinivorans]MCD2115520.1 amidohydrolase family protein [Rhodococcus pyridinivorans]MCZ4624259.1 amidohydrolase family protein [Rhodococcus pyridinivorans]MCZ4645471.1 amidohydrolase family protein [Rhodococcus pyridinivorans]MDJ0481850.1 amidohydrolase family protein [Rhodococcus pyridinivorans]MDV7251576.1 amidohydrolase family protein [Rhodococcus pyridinivorans]
MTVTEGDARSFVVRGRSLADGETVELFVGADGSFTAEPGRDAEVLCADGWILPGLVDAHCHVGIRFGGGAEDEEGLLAQAVTERDAGVLLLRDAGSPVDTRALDQRADLPRVIRAGRHIALPKRYIRGLPVDLEDESQLPDEVARQARAGDGWVKLIGDWIDREVGDLAPLWSDEILVEAIAAAHREGARVTAHVLGEDALSGLLAAGIDCIEHGTGLTDETIGAAHEAGIPIYAGTDAGGQVQHGRIADEIASLVRVGLDPTEAYAVRPGGLGAPRAAVERVRGVTGCRFRPGSRVWQNGSLSSHPVTYRAAVTG